MKKLVFALLMLISFTGFAVNSIDSYEEKESKMEVFKQDASNVQLDVELNLESIDLDFNQLFEKASFKTGTATKSDSFKNKLKEQILYNRLEFERLYRCKINYLTNYKITTLNNKFDENKHIDPGRNALKLI